MPCRHFLWSLNHMLRPKSEQYTEKCVFLNCAMRSSEGRQWNKIKHRAWTYRSVYTEMLLLFVPLIEPIWNVWIADSETDCSQWVRKNVAHNQIAVLFSSEKCVCVGGGNAAYLEQFRKVIAQEATVQESSLDKMWDLVPACAVQRERERKWLCKSWTNKSLGGLWKGMNLTVCEWDTWSSRWGNTGTGDAETGGDCPSLGHLFLLQTLKQSEESDKKTEGPEKFQ